MTAGRTRLPPARTVPIPGADSDGEVDAALAAIEAAFARIEAGDFDATETILASEGAALDVIFRQFAKDSAKGQLLFHEPMRMALRAQAQCRATLECLVSLKSQRGRARPSRASQIPQEQTIERSNSAA